MIECRMITNHVVGLTTSQLQRIVLLHGDNFQAHRKITVPCWNHLGVVSQLVDLSWDESQGDHPLYLRY